jgi:UDP-N-acetylglucosamine--N-acetylmuramyl-(pentapeptide) pyrophosphoryl-undecaprenol N-acetylglucosamine transferase
MMGEATTIFFAGGGTGGHLYPGIATAESLRAILPQAKPVFLCTTRAIDKIILEPTGFEFITQPIVPPERSLSGLLRFWKRWRETKEQLRGLIRERRPALVLGLGGYAAGAAVRFAASRKIPAALINPDVIPGKANQYLMQYVQKVCCQFAQTREYVAAAHRDKLRITGCPIRSFLRNLPDRQSAAQKLGLDPHRMTLVVTGASQGAQTVNEAILEVLKELRPQGWQILHLAGRDHIQAVREGYRELGLLGGTDISAQVIDFTPDMADIWAVADLAVSRSGASSCAELTACGIASVLMPYPFHKDSHQKLNARVLADAGAALAIQDERDRKKNAAQLRPILESLLFDAPKRQAMAAAAKLLGKPAAADAVAAEIADMVGDRC